MTTVSQCCLEGMIFCNLDPSLNKEAQKKQIAKEANDTGDSDSDDGNADDEEDLLLIRVSLGLFL
jgi:hypothetical protein